MATPVIPDRYQKLINDPANRYKVPTQYLPAPLRKLRVEAQARKAMADPTAIVSGSALESVAKRVAGLEINPQIAALKRQQQEATAANEAISQRIAGFNQQYMANLSQMAQSAEGPFKSTFQGLQAAAPVGAANTQRDLAYELAGTNRDISGKIGDVEAQRGPLFTKNLSELRQQQFENLALGQEYNLKVQSEQNNAAAQTAKLLADQKKTDFDQSYKTAQIDIRRGIDPVTGLRIPKTKSASDALSTWKLQWLRSNQGKGLRPPWLAPASKKSVATEDPKEFVNTARKFKSLYGDQIGQVVRGKDGKAILDEKGHAKRVSQSDIKKALLGKVDDVDLVNGLMDILSGRYGGKLGPVNRKIWQRRKITVPARW